MSNADLELNGQGCRQKILDADCFLFASPEYNYSVSGEEEEYSDDADFDSDVDSDDSDRDPSYCVVDETVAKFTRHPIKNSKTPTVEETKLKLEETDSNETVLDFSKLDIMDDKYLEKIKMIVEAGQTEKLKLDQCKMYLRKNGLRLSGNKNTLVKRIKEHLEILNAGGEKKYPVSSFVLNCTGDACAGDVVMFEQNVYEMFNLASRSATGPPCGTRTIVGRIVKEGYGATKQQHTFTVEVLWSKGTKPLPPLYPLLIKGRNLYRMKTLRQRWENEGDRQRVLLEKHSRGSRARSARETRVLEKENRKMLKKNRVSRKEGSNGTSTAQAQQTVFIVSDSSRKSTDPQQPSLSTAPQNVADNIKKNGREHFQKVPSQLPSRPLTGMNLLQSTGQPILLGHMEQLSSRPLTGKNHLQSTGQPILQLPSRPLTGMNLLQSTGPPILLGHMEQLSSRPLTGMNHLQSTGQPILQGHMEQPSRRPLRGMNHLQSTGQPIILQGHTERQYCRHYARGSCYYGENCKFLHDVRENHVTVMEKRGTMDQATTTSLWHNPRVYLN